MIINRLSKETRPYLHQDTEYPADLHPLVEETYNKSKIENKPILLSIGCLASSWHIVIAHEPCEDQDTTNIRNKYYIDLKFDVDEKPDLDKIYWELQNDIEKFISRINTL